MNINLIQALDYDFDIMEGNTFNPYLDFFQDTKFIVPTDLTGSTFVFDIQRPDGCMCFANNPKETLELGSGLTIGNDDDGHVNNRLSFSKILESTPGNIRYKQNLIWTDTAGVVVTVVRGDLKIEAKV